MLTTDVENFPGFPEGIMGPELMSNFRSQAQRFGAKFITEKVTAVNFENRPFEISVGNDKYLTRSVIISTGAQSLMLNIPNESRLIGHGLSTCATCDGFFFRDQEIAVVGGGDSAIEEAIFLTRFASKVYLIHRRDELRASKIMQERAFQNPKLEFLWNNEVAQINGDQKLDGITLNNTITSEKLDLKIQGLFIAIGHRPNTDLFKGHLELKDNGYLVTLPDSSRTAIDGVFACGDVQDDYYRQAITAAGSGCMAAIDAERWLEEHGH